MQLGEFFWEREAHLFERRGFKSDEVRVVSGLVSVWSKPFYCSACVSMQHPRRAVPKSFRILAFLFKRVKNITKELTDKGIDLTAFVPVLQEPSEAALLNEMLQRWPTIDKALKDGQLIEAMHKLAKLHAPVDKFFKDVLVMAEDPAIREARLGLLTQLRVRS